MPELPEVHALVADLGVRLTGRVIDRFDVLSFAALKTFDPPASALSGGTIAAIARHGKFLDISVVPESRDGGAAEVGVPPELHLIIHLARAGWIHWREEPPPPPSRLGKGPLAARLVLRGSEEGDTGPDDRSDAGQPDDGGRGGLRAGSGFNITEAGTKKSLALYVVANPDDVPGIARLGPDPLDAAFTEQALAEILASAGRSQIKGVLRNQSVIAGIGNAYSDEILHTAKMSPFKPAAMTSDDVARLYAATQSTLRQAIARADGLSASELKKEKKSGMQVHGRTGEACPVCGDTVREVIFADSTLQYCPTCQTGGKRLADRVLSRLLK